VTHTSYTSETAEKITYHEDYNKDLLTVFCTGLIICTHTSVWWKWRH